MTHNHRHTRLGPRRVIQAACLALATVLLVASPADAWQGTCQVGSLAGGNYYDGQIRNHVSTAILDREAGPGIWFAERSWAYHYESGQLTALQPEFQFYQTQPFLYGTTGFIGGEGTGGEPLSRVFSVARGSFAVYTELWASPDGQTWAEPIGEWSTFDIGGYWCTQ